MTRRMVKHPLGNPAGPGHIAKQRETVLVSMPRRLIALVLAVASVVLIVDALLDGWRLAEIGAAWNGWLPAATLLVAGLILLGGARALLTPAPPPASRK